MSRLIPVAAAQSGPIQKAESRQAVVKRLTDLLDQAHEKGVNFVVFTELALTTFFPRWYMTDQTEVDQWFEREMPNAATRPLFEKAAQYKIGFYLGCAELTPDGQHYNTAILVDRDGKTVGKYRKVHLPGHDDFDPERAFQHLEKRYFEPGNLGFPVWRTMGGVMGMCICNDRRWPETYRVMGLQGVEMVVLGYNTPAVNSQRACGRPSCGGRKVHRKTGRRDRRDREDRRRRAGDRRLRSRRHYLQQGDDLRLQAPSPHRALRPDHQPDRRDVARLIQSVMPGLLPGIHDLLCCKR